MKKTKMLKKNYEFKNVLSKGKYFSGDYIESFIKNSSDRGRLNKWFNLGVLEGVDDTNSYWYDLYYDIEERGNLYCEYWELTNPWYHGILRINQKTGKPVVKIIKNER